jgi:hypothetical protein
MLSAGTKSQIQIGLEVNGLNFYVRFPALLAKELVYDQKF